MTQAHETAITGPNGLWLHPFGTGAPVVLEIPDGDISAALAVAQWEHGLSGCFALTLAAPGTDTGGPSRVVLTVDRYSHQLSTIRAHVRTEHLHPPMGWIHDAFRLALIAATN